MVKFGAKVGGQLAQKYMIQKNIQTTAMDHAIWCQKVRRKHFMKCHKTQRRIYRLMMLC